MKNITIFGTSRSGKSTFSDVLPNNNINSIGGVGMVQDFPNFISKLLYKNIKSSKGHFSCIVETCDIPPRKARGLFEIE